MASPAADPALTAAGQPPAPAADEAAAVAGLPVAMPELDDPHIPEETGNALLNQLVPANPPWLLEKMGSIINDPRLSPTWRNYVVQHVAHHFELHGDPRALDLLAVAAACPVADVQEVAVFSLARLARDHDRDDIRRRAAQAIDQALLPDRPILVRDAAIRAIGACGDRAKTGRLLAIAGDPRSPAQLRLAAIDVLGAWQEAAAIPIMERITASGNDDMLVVSARRARDRMTPPPSP